jgi:tRNA (guanine-N7-)-methyltransferase
MQGKLASPDKTPAAPRAGAFYGRSKGKALRPGQADLIEGLLPRLRLPETGAIDDPSALFPMPVKAIHLEIGFGGGEHLAHQASLHPEIGFIGCEPFLNGQAKVLAAIASAKLDNIRLWDRDAAVLLERLPDAALEVVYLLYPDPWPKKRHNKRRFVSAERLDAIARVLKPGGFFRFATDIDDYTQWTVERAAACSTLAWTETDLEACRTPWADWIETRYEAKARREGRGSHYLMFRKSSF